MYLEDVETPPPIYYLNVPLFVSALPIATADNFVLQELSHTFLYHKKLVIWWATLFLANHYVSLAI